MFSDSGHQILNWVYDIKMNANLNKQTYDKNYNSPSLDNKFRRQEPLIQALYKLTHRKIKRLLPECYFLLIV